MDRRSKFRDLQDCRLRRALGESTDDYRRRGVNFGSISFLNADRGCAVGNSSFIYCTSDGGETWSKAKAFPPYPSGSPYISQLLLFPSGIGWAAVDGKLYKTEDSAKSFREVLTSGHGEADISSDSPALTTSINGPTELVYFRDGSLYIIEGEQGQLLHLDLKRGLIRAMVLEPQNDCATEEDCPTAVATDQYGNVFVVDFQGQLREVESSSGAVKVLRPKQPKGSDPTFQFAASIAGDPQGNLLLFGAADRKPTLFRWLTSSQTLETVAGRGGPGFGNDGGLAISPF